MPVLGAFAGAERDDTATMVVDELEPEDRDGRGILRSDLPLLEEATRGVSVDGGCGSGSVVVVGVEAVLKLGCLILAERPKPPVAPVPWTSAVAAALEVLTFTITVKDKGQGG